jgi:hypothetical protein
VWGKEGQEKTDVQLPNGEGVEKRHMQKYASQQGAQVAE